MRFVAALVVLVACGGAQTPAAVTPIALLDPGAEPREVLRQQPQLRAREAVAVTTKLRSTGEYTNTVLESARSTLDYPSIVTTEEAIGYSASATSPVVVSAVVSDVHVLDDVVDPRMKAIAQRQAKRLRGTSLSWQLEPSGRTSQIRSSLRDYVPGLLDSWALVPGFPEAAVGIGARWSQTVDTTLGGIRWTQTRTITLTALDDTTASLTIDVNAHADSQALRTEPNSSIRLTSGNVHATGDIRVPLHGLMWTGDIHASTELNLRIVKGHLRVTTTQAADITTHVQRAQQ